MENDANKKPAASPTKKLRAAKKTSPRTRASSVKKGVSDDVVPTKVVALFTPDGAQYFAHENHAHFALEKYRKDKGVDVKNIKFIHFTSMEQAMEGYDNYQNNRKITNLDSERTAIVDSDDNSNSDAKLSSDIDMSNPAVQKLLTELVAKELAKKNQTPSVPSVITPTKK